MNNIPQGLGQLIAAQKTAQQAQQALQQLQQTASMTAPAPQGQRPSVAGQIGQSLAQTAAALSPPPPQPTLQPVPQPGVSQANPFMQQQLATLQAQAQAQAQAQQQAQAAPPQPQGIEAAMQQQPPVTAAHGGAIQRFQAGGGPQFSLSNTPPDQQLFLLYSLLSDPRLSDDEKIGIKQYIKDTFQRGTVPTAQPAPGMLDTLPKPQPVAQNAAPAFPGAAQAETDPVNPAYNPERVKYLQGKLDELGRRQAPTPYTEEQAYIDAAKGMQTMPWAEKRAGIAALQAEQDKILERQRQLYEKSKEGDTFNRWMALLGGAGRRGVGGGADAVEAFEDKLKQREAGFTQQMIQNRDFMQEMQKVAQSATADEYRANLGQALAKAKDYDQAALIFRQNREIEERALRGELGAQYRAWAQKYVADERTQAAATRAGAGGDPIVKQKLAAMKADPRYAGIKKQLEDTAKFASSTSPVIRQQYAAAQEAYIRFMQSHGLTPSDAPEEFPGVSSGTPGVTPGAAPAGWGKATLVR